MKKISMISAVASNGVIGSRNGLPWGKILQDMRRFKSMTLGKPVIMGRKTFESLVKPLDDRVNIVITSQSDFSDSKFVHCAKNKTEALELAEQFGKGDEVMVIGGAKIYGMFLPEASTLYITHLHRNFPGDTFFPFLAPCQWKISQRAEYKAVTELGNYPMTFVTYKRKN